MGILSNMKSAAGVKGDEGGSDVMRRRVGEDMSQGEVWGSGKWGGSA